MRLQGEDGGAGEPVVVFLHSLGGRTEQWRAQLEHVRRRTRAIGLDWRGHGRSSVPEDGSFAVPDLAADVIDTLRQMGVRESLLVGHSAGAAIVEGCVAQVPEAVQGVFLLDPVGDMRAAPREDLEPFMQALEGEAYEEVIMTYWEELLEGAEPGTRQQVLVDLRAIPKETVVGVFKALSHFDPVRSIWRYSGPILTVITRFNTGPTSLHNLLPELRTRTIAGTSHWPQLDRPTAINSLLDEFLGAIRG
jgi:pimeloyl-ACP methyl ester carboxylesterase